ncbi:MAG: enoyl-CoA hydratase-related protein [Flammeovirgaceae bacterium]
MNLILYHTQDKIAYITLNRPEKRNALSAELVTELKQAFQQATDDSQVKVIILRAEGKVFCAGADLGYLQQLQSNTFEENLADSQHLKELFWQIYTLPKPVIAQVQGHAIAGGCGLAAVCDFVFAVESAKFGYTEVKIGFIPAIVMVFLLRKIGEGRAKELLLFGELIDAKMAWQYGLVNEVVPENELNNRVWAFANKICLENSPQAIATTKRMMYEIYAMNMPEALQFAAQQNAKARESADCKKGIASFLNKEKIVW